MYTHAFNPLNLTRLHRSRTWTRLATTAERGSRTITLADPVDWVVGENITITSTVSLWLVHPERNV
jgi:hypothetical protein